MEAYRFNENGITAALQYLSEGLLDDTSRSSLVSDRGLITKVEPVLSLEWESFVTRRDMGRYLANKLRDAPYMPLVYDRGFWAWLSFSWFDSLCATRADGSLAPGEHARWVPVFDDWRKYYRHLVLTPTLIELLHQECDDCTLVALAGSPTSPGEVAEQLTARQSFAASHGVLRAAGNLYLNNDRKLKRGSGGSGPGSARRLADVLNQLDRTYDLMAISAEDLLNLLPGEFDRFR